MSQRFTIRSRRVGPGIRAFDVLGQEGRLDYVFQVLQRGDDCRMVLADSEGVEIAHTRIGAAETQGRPIATFSSGERMMLSYTLGGYTATLSVRDFGWELVRAKTHGMYHVVDGWGEKCATIVRGQETFGSYAATIQDTAHTEELLMVMGVLCFLLGRD